MLYSKTDIISQVFFIKYLKYTKRDLRKNIYKFLLYFCLYTALYLTAEIILLYCFLMI